MPVSSCVLGLRFPFAHRDNKLFQPHLAPEASPAPSACGCHPHRDVGVMDGGCGEQGIQLELLPTHHTALMVPITPGLCFQTPAETCCCHRTSPWSRDSDTASPQCRFYMPHLVPGCCPPASACPGWLLTPWPRQGGARIRPLPAAELPHHAALLPQRQGAER